ncbi:glucose 1-dehydrogenase [Natronolimnobius baerhuensis]|uniref:Glucose 1-dehydrogenase n=1 Tax=Natronolimnobius baerhuensis TaxID=253108 RepID=A0A202E8J9_9EURY|nr:glucose 1-dehydrogenase [Natronolimnobius baerhuensis]OVE84468.1 glucose dehydrogenase [Natronolimnobius baerhuensis]
MKAIAVEPGAGEPELIERPRPDPEPGEALVRTLRVGVDGTDHEVIAGHHGNLPDGADRLVLGHEAVGVVEDPNGTALEAGQIVAATVRRRPNGVDNEYFARGEPDMAPAGKYVERGIVGADGFMAEYFTSPADALVPVPDEYASLGFLVEPISISEKALEHALASRAAFDWHLDTGLVLGNGSLGLITLAMLEASEIERTYCLGRRDRPDPTIEMIEELGGTYIDSRETPVSEVAAEYEGMDLVYEATGYAKHAFETVDALAPNGVGVLLGVPDDWDFEVDGGRLHQELVLHNKALLGTVNSHRGHFEAAVDTLAQLPEWFTDDLVTGVYGLEEFDHAFETGDDVIKTAIEFSSR